jgi:hypothetical protein
VWNGAKDTRKRLEHLSALGERLVIRADHLPADLALLGLLEDLRGAASAVLALSEDAPSFATYPLARTAFEATQRIIALATDDDYLRTGARAWLYYHRKDARILRMDEGSETAEAWLASAVGRMLDVWRAYHPDAETILSQEKERLQTNEGKRGPDNFMCQDLARLVGERYPRALPGMEMSPAEVKRMSRSLYAYLSREAHARLRVDPVGYRISPDGSLTIVQRQANETERRETALRSLDSSIAEAIGALSYFLERRDREHAEQTRLGAMEVTEESLPPGFDRDLGLHLATAGVGDALIEFSAVPVYNLAVLPNGTAVWSAGLRLGGTVFLATFDVPTACVPDLARALAIPAAVLRGTGVLRKPTLPIPTRIAVQCKLGTLQRTDKQRFIPLVVERASNASRERV